ncbi:MAG: CoA pyrophosphatase [Thaumarchaeota archaeon]|nr:CoA pyrophosphatase [Nitrososphaerota archaeon]
MLLRERSHVETLMIKRAERQGDPWSGQVAFPGGRREPSDDTPRDTAIRETREETGIDLITNGTFLGYFGTFQTHTGTMLVIPCVFSLKKEVQIRSDEEVASFKWVPLETFASESARSVHTFKSNETTVKLPAFRYEDYLIWGLTHRIITTLFGEESEAESS